MTEDINTAADALPESLFVSDAVRRADVKLPSGKVHTMHFRDMTQADFRAFNEGNASTDAEIRRAASAKLIATCVCNADGTPAMDVTKAGTLKPVAVIAITNAVLAINDFTEGNE